MSQNQIPPSERGPSDMVATSHEWPVTPECQQVDLVALKRHYHALQQMLLGPAALWSRDSIIEDIAIGDRIAELGPLLHNIGATLIQHERAHAANLAELAELRGALERIANMPEYDQDDAHRLRDHARAALAKHTTGGRG